jgi:hypothetical protein
MVSECEAAVAAAPDARCLSGVAAAFPAPGDEKGALPPAPASVVREGGASASSGGGVARTRGQQPAHELRAAQARCSLWGAMTGVPWDAARRRLVVTADPACRFLVLNEMKAGQEEARALWAPRAG